MDRRPIIYKYPLDLTGVNPDHLVRQEQQTLPTGQPRAIVPNYGAFYADSLVVRDRNSGAVLIPNIHYIVAQRYETASDITGKEVSSVIVITDPSVYTEIEYDYQVIGGEFSHSVLSLRTMLSVVDWSTITLTWGVRLGDPEPYPPAPHIHEAGDLYGFSYLVMALEYLRFAVHVGNEVDHDVLRRYIDWIHEEMLAKQAAHKADYSNPHEVTKAQVGLSVVKNYPIATESEARGGSDHSSYMTPLRHAQAIDTQFGVPFNAHRNDRSNPHNVTQTQVGLSNADNTSDMDKPVHHAFKQLGDSHALNRNNPHGVTAAQADTYTRDEMNGHLNWRLHIGATAVNSAKLEWLTASDIVSRISDAAISRANTLYAPKNHTHGYALIGHSH